MLMDSDKSGELCTQSAPAPPQLRWLRRTAPGEADLLAPSQLEGLGGLLWSPAVSPALAGAGLCPGSSSAILAHRNYSQLEDHPRAWLCPATQLLGISALLSLWLGTGWALGTRLLAGGVTWIRNSTGTFGIAGCRSWDLSAAGRARGHQLHRAFVFCHHPCTLRSSHSAGYKEKMNVGFGVVVGLGDVEGVLQLKRFCKT